jgi:hypothetical protein
MKKLVLAFFVCLAGTSAQAQLFGAKPLSPRSLADYGVSIPAVTSSSVSYPGCPGEVVSHTNTWYFDAAGQTQTGGGLGTVAHPWNSLQALTGDNAGTPTSGYTQILLATAPGGNGSSPVKAGDLILVNTGSYGALTLGASTAIVNSPAITIKANAGQTPLFTSIAASEVTGLHLEGLTVRSSGGGGTLVTIKDNFVANSTSDIILANMDVSSASVATGDGWTPASTWAANAKGGVGFYAQSGVPMNCTATTSSHIYEVGFAGLAGGVEGESSSLLVQGNEIDHVLAPAINFNSNSTAIGSNNIHDFVDNGIGNYQHYAIQNTQNGIITPSLYQSNLYLYKNVMVESVDASQTLHSLVSFFLNSCGDITNVMIVDNKAASSGASGIGTGNMHNFLVINNSMMNDGSGQDPEINLTQAHCGSTGPYGNPPSGGFVINNIAPIFNNPNQNGVQTYNNIAAPTGTFYSVWTYLNVWQQVFVGPTAGSVITLPSISGQQNYIDGGVGGTSPQAHVYTTVACSTTAFPCSPQPDWTPINEARTVGGVQLIPPITDFNGATFTPPYSIGALN